MLTLYTDNHKLFELFKVNINTDFKQLMKVYDCQYIKLTLTLTLTLTLNNLLKFIEPLMRNCLSLTDNKPIICKNWLSLTDNKPIICKN